MNRPTILQVISLLLWIVYSVFYLAGVSTVPYHPDEATQIFMSDELSSPKVKRGVTAYDRGLRDHYRMIDSPLTHTVIGLERLVTGDTHIRTDWDWGDSWSTNQAVGALPSRQTLIYARLALAWLFPIALLGFYGTIKRLLDEKVALFTCLLFGLNSILLVHTRRAMAEGLQLSLTLILLYLVLRKQRLFTNILIVLVSSLLIQSKQLAIPIVAVSLLVFIIQSFRSGGWKSALVWTSVTVVIVFAFHYLLNPILRPDPLGITVQMFLDRMEFSNSMLNDFSESGSGLALTTPTLRFLGMIAQTFFAPNAYLDTANYVQNVMPEITRYEANPFSMLFSTGWLQVLIFILFLSGLISGMIHWISYKSELVLVFLLITLGLIVFYTGIISIGFQRYYVQLLPFVYLWIGFFFNKIFLVIPTKPKNSIV